MYKTVMTFTRPSVDVPFWQPTNDMILHTQSEYKIVRERAMSEDGLVLTLTNYAETEEIWLAYKAESESGDQDAANARTAYNDENGIVRTWVFKGEAE